MSALRLITIGWAVFGLLLLAVRRRLVDGTAGDDLPERLRATLERLGPTFVKLGQLLSLRRDVLPDAYVLALHGLQDRVAPFPAELARREVERCLGRPLEALFADFESDPFAAASIAQVHHARLKDGGEVVVKSRRPRIQAQIDRDTAGRTACPIESLWATNSDDRGPGAVRLDRNRPQAPAPMGFDASSWAPKNICKPVPTWRRRNLLIYSRFASC